MLKKKKKERNFETSKIVDIGGKSGKISRNINFRNFESQILKKSL